MPTYGHYYLFSCCFMWVGPWAFYFLLKHSDYYSTRQKYGEKGIVNIRYITSRYELFCVHVLVHLERCKYEQIYTCTCRNFKINNTHRSSITGGIFEAMCKGAINTSQKQTSTAYCLVSFMAKKQVSFQAVVIHCPAGREKGSAFLPLPSSNTAIFSYTSRVIYGICTVQLHR